MNDYDRADHDGEERTPAVLRLRIKAKVDPLVDALACKIIDTVERDWDGDPRTRVIVDVGANHVPRELVLVEACVKLLRLGWKVVWDRQECPQTGTSYRITVSEHATAGADYR